MKEKYTDFDWQRGTIESTLIKGNDAKKLYKGYKIDLNKFDNPSDLNKLIYKPNLKEIIGSSPLIGGLINKIVSYYGLRVAVPGDDFKGDIYKLIEDVCYTDFNALVVREKTPEYEKNRDLWKNIIGLAEEKQGKVKFPFMIQGFYVEQDKNEPNYEIKIIPALNFKIIEDERLSGKYNEWGFDKVDEKSLPLNLNQSKDSRIFYTRENGLSGIYLDGANNLDAGCDILTDSDKDARIILVKDKNIKK